MNEQNLSEAIQRLSQNSEIRDIINQLKSGAVSNNVEIREKSENEPGIAGGSNTTNGFGDLSANIEDKNKSDNMSNIAPDLSGLVNMLSPETLASLPSILSMLGTNSSGIGNLLGVSTSSQSNNSKHTESEGGNIGAVDRRALLTALRPFMNEKRKKALDIMIGIEKLGAVLPDGMKMFAGEK